MVEPLTYTQKMKSRTYSIGSRDKILRILISRYGRVCWYCGVQGKEFQIDHIIAIANGGYDDILNFALVCRYCNGTKLAHDVKEFFEWQDHVRSDKFKRYYNPDNHHPLSKLNRGCLADEF